MARKPSRIFVNFYWDAVLALQLESLAHAKKILCASFFQCSSLLAFFSLYPLPFLCVVLRCFSLQQVYIYISSMRVCNVQRECSSRLNYSRFYTQHKRVDLRRSLMDSSLWNFDRMSTPMQRWVDIATPLCTDKNPYTCYFIRPWQAFTFIPFFFLLSKLTAQHSHPISHRPTLLFVIFYLTSCARYRRTIHRGFENCEISMLSNFEKIHTSRWTRTKHCRDDAYRASVQGENMPVSGSRAARIDVTASFWCIRWSCCRFATFK